MGKCSPLLVSHVRSSKPGHFPERYGLTTLLAADESLKFWKLFEKKAGATSGIRGSGSSSKSDMAKQMTIR